MLFWTTLGKRRTREVGYFIQKAYLIVSGYPLRYIWRQRLAGSISGLVHERLEVQSISAKKHAGSQGVY